MLVELVENGLEAEKRKQLEFFALAEQFRNASDPEEAKRLGDALGRMVFGDWTAAMPKIVRWTEFPPNVRQHLIDRMRDRAISLDDLNQLRLWLESSPEVPEGDWYKDFGSFKICGAGKLPKTFLTKGQAAKGQALWAFLACQVLRLGVF
jgi:hypothetical protein